MSVQIALPSSVVISHNTVVRQQQQQQQQQESSAQSAGSSPAASSAVAAAVFVGKTLHRRKRTSSAALRLDTVMLSEPPKPAAAAGAGTNAKSALLVRREGLKLSFNRSISEPLGQHGINTPAIISPPSVAPSLHPSKRCRTEAEAAAAQQSMPPPAVPPPASPATAAAQPASPAMLAPPVQRPNIPGTVSLPNSPCGESSTLQRTIMLQNARTVEASVLARRMTSSNNNGSTSNDVLIVDCRPFIAYNVNHIRGALNVNCCCFNRKRLQQGKASLADLATTKEGKERLKSRTWKEVVVYDDCSESLEKLPVSHTLFLVMNALVEDQREPVMLLGGMRDFQASYRDLCEDHLMKSASQTAVPATPSPLTASTASPLTASSLLPDLPSPSDLCDTKDIENHPASQVLPYLFLGNMRDASDAGALRRLGIRFVLNVTAKPPAYTAEPDIEYKQLEAADNGVQNLRQFFEEAFAFIDRARAAKSGVLIHCHAGVSRSPTIAVAYLMQHYPMAMSEAYKFVKTRRTIISPNLNFMGQLWEFEQCLRTENNNAASTSRKEPLTVEMLQVKENLAKSAFDIESSCAGKPNVAAPGDARPTFKWSEATAVAARATTPRSDGAECNV